MGRNGNSNGVRGVEKLSSASETSFTGDEPSQPEGRSVKVCRGTTQEDRQNTFGCQLEQ